MGNMKNFIKTAAGCVFTVEEYKHNILEQLENNFDGETFDSVRAAEQYAEDLWDYDDIAVIDENGEKVSEEKIAFEFLSKYNTARAEYIEAAVNFVKAREHKYYEAWVMMDSDGAVCTDEYETAHGALNEMLLKYSSVEELKEAGFTLNRLLCDKKCWLECLEEIEF